MESLFLGLDVGASAVKAVGLDGAGVSVYERYFRHRQEPLHFVRDILREVGASFPGARLSIALSGEQGKELAEELDFPYLSMQEALLLFVRSFMPDVSAVLELGGESGRLTFFHPSIVQRENRGCAGGTGAFLDNLACLFGTDTEGLEQLAEKGKRVYPIASRCGVYAKTDIQGLLNEGASKEDLALSVFHGLAYQAVSDLLQGRVVTGKAALLGGPFAFLPLLRDAFFDLLGVKEEDRVIYPSPALYGALGAAVFARDRKRPHFPEQWLPAAIRRMRARKEIDETLPPLFGNTKEYEDFRLRHERARVPSARPMAGEPLWLGIDAGSTTMKAVLVNKDRCIVASSYGRHGGEVVEKAASMVRELLAALPSGCTIAGAGVTGYGEELVKTALSLDFGKVETMAHLKAARYFCPDLTSLLDIGGQDMKYMHLSGGRVDKVLMNSACSSGCGAFLETFAGNRGLTAEEFGKEALSSGPFPHYGAHCTVLMNTRIHRGKNRASDGKALAAGLCYAVVENALTRVLQLESPEELGNKVVVEGGTFYNDAVLRSFEKITGLQVIRPDAAGLMGAYGVALYGREMFEENHISSMISAEEMGKLTLTHVNRTCQGCGNHCVISIYDFGGRCFGTGNRCETGAALIPGRKKEKLPDLMQWVKDHVFRKCPAEGEKKGTVGIPAALTMWSDFPFWAAFWASLGYEVRLSRYSEKAVEKTVSTIPRRVHCHPCLLAHAHVQELLDAKPDFIWFPAMRRGIRGNGTDEKRHAHYPRILKVYMRRNIEEAGVPCLAPSLPDLFHPRLLDVLAGFLPFDRKFLEKAVEKGRENLLSYRKAYAEETEKALSFCRKSGKPAILLLARSFQADPLIHKGLPGMVTTLGAPVLTAEGLSLLNGEEEIRNGGSFIRESLPFISGEKFLLPVPLRSSSCGMDREAMEEAQQLFREIRRPWIALTVDQGTNTGALKIRIRTVLEEAGE